MIEEPYRWVEAIQNRREYIEHQIAPGSPIVCVSCAEGVLLLTVSRDRQKLFEVYDRIALGAIGHPGDVERLRLMAIEVASAEGFRRSPHDVSLRRLVHYSLSPALKDAFEHVYGPPYLARLLLAELGRPGEGDLLVRLGFDGSFQTNGGGVAVGEPFSVLAGQERAASGMETYLREHRAEFESHSFEEAYTVALDAWCTGHLLLGGRHEGEGLPDAAAVAAHREKAVQSATVEAVVLERAARGPNVFRAYHAPSPVAA